MFFRNVVFAQFLVDLTKSVPSIVVAAVCCNRAPIRVQCLVKLFIGNVFMTLQSIRVGIFWVELGGASKAFHGLLVFALQGKGVPDCAPGLW